MSLEDLKAMDKLLDDKYQISDKPPKGLSPDDVQSARASSPAKRVEKLILMNY